MLRRGQRGEGAQVSQTRNRGEDFRVRLPREGLYPKWDQEGDKGENGVTKSAVSQVQPWMEWGGSWIWEHSFQPHRDFLHSSCQKSRALCLADMAFYVKAPSNPKGNEPGGGNAKVKMGLELTQGPHHCLGSPSREGKCSPVERRQACQASLQKAAWKLWEERVSQRKTKLDSQLGRHRAQKKGTRKEWIPARGRYGSQIENSFKAGLCPGGGGEGSESPPGSPKPSSQMRKIPQKSYMPECAPRTNATLCSPLQRPAAPMPVPPPPQEPEDQCSGPPEPTLCDAEGHMTWLARTLGQETKEKLTLLRSHLFLGAAPSPISRLHTRRLPNCSCL